MIELDYVEAASKGFGDEFGQVRLYPVASDRNNAVWTKPSDLKYLLDEFRQSAAVNHHHLPL